MSDPQGILTTFYARELIIKPSLDHLRPKRPVPMAVELPKDVAQALVKYLQERLDDETGNGAIRIHLLGDLSHV